MKYHMEKVTDLAGFAVENVAGPVTAKVQVRGMLTSDQPAFFKYTEQIAGLFLAKNGVTSNYVNTFLVVIHADLSADVYVNDIAIAAEIRPKRPIQKGEVVTDTDIADIGKVTFPDIPILPTDKVAYCFKVGWRFGLYFDFSYHTTPPKGMPSDAPKELNVEKMQRDIGDLFRYLTFYHVYRVLEAGAEFEAMLNDGWFPFLEMLPKEYKPLSEAYGLTFDIKAKTNAVVASFTPDRIAALTAKWWGSAILADKRKLIEAGIDAYVQGTDAGNINCIKTLASEIEGVLRTLYHSETGKADGVKTPELIAHIIDKGAKSTGSELSLLLPTPFLEYLQRVTFANFSVATGDVNLSRHSTGHGVAKAEQYTRVRALQFILSLDQMYYYLG